MRWSIAAVSGAVVISGSLVSVPEGHAATSSLASAVSEVMVEQHGEWAADSYGLGGAVEAADPIVEAHRFDSSEQWAFGGSAFELPDNVHANPVTSLFIALATGGEWQVALHGDEDFSELVSRAPDDLFTDTGERRMLVGSDFASDARPGLALPWAENQDGWRHWGVHGNGGNTRPFNAIDFYAGDGKVRASAPGYLYRFCGTVNPYVEVHHVNGWATGYYHLRDQTDAPSGSYVERYEYLGEIAEELPCGGRANGDHVHWTLWHQNQEIAVAGRVIGGYTWHEGDAYRGWAGRAGDEISHSDCCLQNFGPFDGWLYGVPDE